MEQQSIQRAQEAAELNESAAEQERFDFMMWPGVPLY
jgi:hypothetical protein